MRQEYALFSVGEYVLNDNEIATFATSKPILKNQGVNPFAPYKAPPTLKNAKPAPVTQAQANNPFTNSSGKTRISVKQKGGAGVRKGHIRNIGGKAVAVGQSIIKAGARTAGSLASGAKGLAIKGASGAKGLAVKGASGAKGLAVKGYGAAGSGASAVKKAAINNPKTAIAAGAVGVAGAAAGGTFLATRKKRKRR